MKQTGQTLVPQPTSWSYDPKTGFRTKRAYKCTTLADLTATESSLQAGRWSYDVVAHLEDGANGWWEINATRGADPDASIDGEGGDEDTPISESWELSSNLIEKDLLESDHSLILGLWEDAGSFNQTAFNPQVTQEEAFSIYVQWLKSVNDDPKSYPITKFAASGNATAIARLLINGVKSIRVFQPTLRHNTIVSDRYTIKDALTNVGNILPASQIAFLENIPNTLLFNLPDPPLEGASPRADAMGRNLRYGWFKKYPNVTELADDQWQIQQEFEWGLWHTSLYTFAG